MLFDKLCAIVERRKRDQRLRRILEEAKIFEFPGRAHEILKNSPPSDEEIEFFKSHFFLPFPVIAVEDTASCVILWDFDQDAHGLHLDRGFIEITPLAPDKVDEFSDPISQEELKKRIGVLPPEILNNINNIYAVQGGVIQIYVESNRQRCITQVGGSSNFAFLASKDIDYGDLQRQHLDGREQISLLKNPAVAMEEVMYFNSPSRFIVAKEPTKVKKRKGKKAKAKIPRSVDRPTYTILKPREIRDKLGFPRVEGHRKVRPHERRRHFRTLSDDRFTRMKGKTIVVKASWIGPSEKVVGKHKYRVCLDL